MTFINSNMVKWHRGLSSVCDWSSLYRRLKYRRSFRQLQITPQHRHYHLDWCRYRESSMVSDWRNLNFECEFYLSADEYRICVRRQRGQLYTPAFFLLSLFSHNTRCYSLENDRLARTVPFSRVAKYSDDSRYVGAILQLVVLAMVSSHPGAFISKTTLCHVLRKPPNSVW